MTERFSQLYRQIKEQVTEAENCLKDLVHHLKSPHESSPKEFDHHLKTINERCHASCEQAVEAGHRLKHFIEEAKTEAIAHFEDWKTDRAIAHLEAQADKKEHHAVDALILAAHSILEAEVAIAEALKARKTVIEVSG